MGSNHAYVTLVLQCTLFTIYQSVHIIYFNTSPAYFTNLLIIIPPFSKRTIVSPTGESLFLSFGISLFESLIRLQNYFFASESWSQFMIELESLKKDPGLPLLDHIKLVEGLIFQLNQLNVQKAFTFFYKFVIERCQMLNYKSLIA